MIGSPITLTQVLTVDTAGSSHESIYGLGVWVIGHTHGEFNTNFLPFSSFLIACREILRPGTISFILGISSKLLLETHILFGSKSDLIREKMIKMGTWF